MRGGVASDATKADARKSYRQVNPSLQAVVSSLQHIRAALDQAPHEWWKDEAAISSQQAAAAAAKNDDDDSTTQNPDVNTEPEDGGMIDLQQSEQNNLGQDHSPGASGSDASP